MNFPRLYQIRFPKLIIVFMGICMVLGSWLISQSFSTQHAIIEKTENTGGGSIAK